MRIRIFQIILSLVMYYQSYAANILLLQELLSHSHHLWFKKVTAGLVAAGHNVTVVSGEVDTSLDNLHYIYMDKVYETIYKTSENFDLFDMGQGSPFLQVIFLSQWTINSCKGFLASDGWEVLKNYPKDFKFDLVIHDFPAGQCLLAFLQKFNYPPMIFMTAYSDYNFISYATKSSLTPSLSTHVTVHEPQTTLLQRIENFLLHFVDYMQYNYYISPKCDKLLASSFHNLPPLMKLAQRSIITLFNYDAAVDGVRQLPPNVIGVGGLQIQTPKNLTGELESIADQADNGLILFSLGTNLKSELLGDVRITHILKAFANFPDYTFLWKFEADKLPMESPKNVFISKWIPQNDVLAHKNTKLFITHSGLLSTQEAIWYGVPMLGIPIFIDQFGNSFKSVSKGIAEQLYLQSLSNVTLTDKIQQLLSNPKYKENIDKVSRAFRDQKETPLERGLWWIEWALRNPNAVHFKSYGADLNFFHIHSVDVIAFLTIIVLVVVLLLLAILRKLLLLVLRKENSMNSKKKNEFKKVTAGLVAVGHNVTVVSGMPDISSENLHYIYMDKVYETVYNTSENVDFFKVGQINPFLQLSVLHEWIVNTCKGFLASDGWEILKNYPKDFKFDLIIHDCAAGLCLLAFLEKFNYPPMIFMTAYGDFNVISYATKSSLTPCLSTHVMIREPQTSFLRRINNFLLHFVDYVEYNYFILPECDQLLTSSFNKLPPLTELAQRSIITLFNYDAAVDGFRQLPPKVIGVGGLQIQNPKNLTSELKSIADQAEGGLILFSLGTNVKSELLGDVRITHILNAFANFPDYTFLWKFEADKLPTESLKNVFISKWIPQNDVLAHKNIKLFITHAGLLSTQEAIWYGVPMLGIPIFIDQFGNSFKSVSKGIAEQLDIESLSSVTLTDKIQQLLSNPKYRENMNKASGAFRDQKETPLERGLWWIDWALRNPNAVHFKSYGNDLNFVQIHSIDVIAFLTITALGVVLVLFVILRRLLKLLVLRKGNLMNSKKKYD